MNTKDFLRNFAEQFEETEVVLFNVDTIFKDLEEWDSLMSLNIIAMVDEEYSVKITGDDIQKANTIHDIFEIVNSRLK